MKTNMLQLFIQRVIDPVLCVMMMSFMENPSHWPSKSWGPNVISQNSEVIMLVHNSGDNAWLFTGKRT